MHTTLSNEIFTKYDLISFKLVRFTLTFLGLCLPLVGCVGGMSTNESRPGFTFFPQPIALPIFPHVHSKLPSRDLVVFCCLILVHQTIVTHLNLRGKETSSHFHSSQEYHHVLRALANSFPFPAESKFSTAMDMFGGGRVLSKCPAVTQRYREQTDGCQRGGGLVD
ncbi:hypothetical protein HJG60_008481 [Phyllostomus discolor]|uniref:Uncharacterized protein n=1 Tax=Phyllostomus discolor TaxID=89673 RepID=A0A833Z337_9CHIR|nr:hypothetical protein HJG60_008481 [Phyllostomus discolor]